MTVATSTSKSGPYNGAGTTGPFPVDFRFLENSHLQVVKTSAAGVETVLVLDSAYTVSGAGASTGSVTLLAALPIGEKLTITRKVPATQEADYVQNDAFPAESHETALDKLTMLVQQNSEILDRAIKLPVSTEGVSAVLPKPVAGRGLKWNGAATALINSNVDLDTVESNAAASAAAAAASAAAAAGSLDSFDDRYLGVKATDPLVDNDGAVLTEGSLYWNSLAKEFRVFNGTIWQSVVQAGNLQKLTYVAGVDYTAGVTTSLVLPTNPLVKANLDIVFDAAWQQMTEYSLAGATVTFNSPIPVGVAQVEISYTVPLQIGVPSDGTVTDAKVASGAAISSAKLSFLQAGTGATARTVQSKLRAHDVEIEDFGGVADGATSFSAAAAAAITYLNSVGGGTLRFGRGVYVLNNNEKISLSAGNITIRGQGIGVTTIKRVGAGTTALIESFSAVDKANICIQDMTIDCNSINSGIQVQYVSRFVVRNCAFLNNGVWGISVGIGNGASSTRVNKEVLITGCFFSNGKSTTENLLLFNSERVSVADCYFSNGKTGGVFPALGLYQNLERVTISGCHFDALDRGLYYSLSANNLTIQGCTFQDCLTGIWGANTPDNGTFGTFNVFGLAITGCQFMRCDNALEVGAVALGSVSDCIFTANINAVVINYGNTPTNAQPSSITFTGCQFLNNNRLSGAAGLYPGVLFSGGGGAVAVTFVGCHFLDNQAVKTQFTCVAFQGAFAWSAIKFFGCSLAFQGAGASIAVGGGATLSNVTLYGCLNLSSLPAGVTTV